jgi:GntR family transcriptional regulator/MocR family aminotransferase
VRHVHAIDLAESIAIEGPGSATDRLASGLRAAILEGRMRPGDVVPSTRALASAVGVARGTVVRVYDELSGEGYLDSVAGSGTFVSANVSARVGHRHAEPAGEAGEANTAGTAGTESQQRAERSTPPGDVIELRPGIPSTASISRPDWASAWRRAVSGDVPSGYPPPSGLESLREQIARHLFHSRGFRCEPSDVVVTSGARESLALVALGLAAHQGRVLRVGCENPGHIGSRRVLERLGARVVPIDVRDGGVDLDSVQKVSISALLVTPSHQYPLGGSLDVGRRLQLLEWALRTRSVIIEDDYDSEFRHGARALPSIASLDTAGLVVHVGSYSKVITPWLRCGYVVAREPAVRAAILDARADLGETVSGVAQQALAYYLEGGGLTRHLARVRRAYAHKRTLVLDALGDLAHPDGGLALGATDGGLHAVLSAAAGSGYAGLASELRGRGLLVGNLADHYVGTPAGTREGIVFGYGVQTDLVLHSALSTISATVARMGTGSVRRGPREPESC